MIDKNKFSKNRRVITMKTKELNKKLLLNKKTIAKLNDSEKKVIMAGKDKCSYGFSGCESMLSCGVCP